MAANLFHSSAIIPPFYYGKGVTPPFYYIKGTTTPPFYYNADAFYELTIPDYFFVLEAPNGTKYGYKITNSGALVPEVTTEAATTYVMTAPDTTKYEITCTNLGALIPTVTALATDPDPQADSPDGQTWELRITNRGAFQPVKV